MIPIPSGTFFRLPPEKQRRLIQAAWEEFTRVNYGEASINQIIRAAQISRGSFYQYFTDKDDLFRYLMEDSFRHLTALLRSALEAHQGDLFQVMLASFDHFVRDRGALEPIFERCARVFQLNPGMDLHRLMACRDELPQPIWEKLDLSAFRSQDRFFVSQVFSLLLLSLGSAVRESMLRPESTWQQRAFLLARMDILRRGALTPLTAQSAAPEL